MQQHVGLFMIGVLMIIAGSAAVIMQYVTVGMIVALIGCALTIISMMVFRKARNK